jgi:hypothetical protein
MLLLQPQTTERYMKKLTSFVAFSALMSAGPVMAAQDIAGVKLGIPLSVQKSLIAKANPAYQLEDIKLRNGVVAGVTGIARKNQQIVDQMVVLQDKTGIVWFVTRGQALDKGNRLQPGAFTASLKEKYGPVSREQEDALSWSFDRSGKQAHGDSHTAPCARIWASGNYYSSVSGEQLNIPSEFDEKCGVAFRAHAGSNSNDGMISSFSVMMVDAARRYDEINAKESGEAAAHKKLLNSEKNNKPKL